MTNRVTLLTLLGLALLLPSLGDAQTWVKKVGGSGLGNSLVVNPLNENILYGSPATTQIYISRNRGYDWSLLGTNVAPSGSVKSIDINPRDTSQMLCGVKVGAVDAIYKSTNRGNSWVETWSGVFSYYGKPVEFTPLHPDTVYTMGGDTLWCSTNFGSTWSVLKVAPGFDAWCDAELHPTDGNIMWVGDYTQGIFKTTDRGNTWTHVYFTSGNGEIPSIACDPFDLNIMYAGQYSNGGGLLKSTNGGNTWFCLPTPVKTTCLSTNGGNTWWVTCSPVHPNYVYFGTYGSGIQGIFISRDGGESWENFSDGLIPNGVLNYGLLALDSLSVFALQGDGIYRLEYPTGIRIDSPSAAAAWKAGSTHDIVWADSGLYAVRIQLSTDGGGSWGTLADSVPAGVGHFTWSVPLTPAPDCRIRISDRLFTPSADTSGAFSIFRTPPVLFSPDGGESWEGETVHMIRWNAVPEITALDIRFTSDSGAHWSGIAAVPGETDSFAWTLPATHSARCKILIADGEDLSSADTSSGFFEIFSRQEFQAAIRIADAGTDADTLVFGGRGDATDSLDPALGEAALPPRPPAGTHDARWLIPGTAGSRTDFRDTLNGDSRLFVSTFQPGPSGYPVSLRWQPESLRTNTFILRDTLTHGYRFSADMKRDSLIQVPDASLAAFEVLECPSVSFALGGRAGWNLVSLPVITGDRSSAGVFPSRASSLFSYAGTYQTVGTIATGRGYWVKMSNPVSETVTGCAFASFSDTVAAGWNMIGVPSYPVAPGTVIPHGVSVVSAYFGYTGGGYVIIGTIANPTLNPGSGYWVKITGGSGTLELNGSPAKAASASVPVEGYHRLAISDDEGNTQELYFGGSADDDLSAEMPPPLPDAQFSASFAGRRILATLPKNSEKGCEFPISIGSAGNKIKVRWGVDNDPFFTYILHRRSGGRELAPTPMSGEGVAAFPFDGETSWSLEVRRIHESTDIPRDFALGNIYPNPFNPDAHFIVAVPSDSYVRIQVFSVLGQEIATLADGVMQAGVRGMTWNSARSTRGPAGSGVYYIRMTAQAVRDASATFSATQKVLLIK